MQTRFQRCRRKEVDHVLRSNLSNELYTKIIKKKTRYLIKVQGNQTPPPLVNEMTKKRKMKRKRSTPTMVVSPDKVKVVTMQPTSNPPHQSIDISSPTISETAVPKSPSHPPHDHTTAVSPAVSTSQSQQKKEKTILEETDTIPLPTVLLQVKEQSSNVEHNKPVESMPFKTALSYIDLQFIKSQRITTDEELATADLSKLAPKYINYSTTKGLGKMSSIEATAIMSKWQLDAQLLLGLESQGVDSDPSQIAQIPKGSRTVMDNVPNLCITDTSSDLVSYTDLVPL